MARSIEEINNDIAMVQKAIDKIKAGKENPGQYSSDEIAQMYALDPNAAQFFVNKQQGETRKEMSPDESRRQLRISMNDSYAAMNNDKLSDAERKLAKAEYDIYLSESEKMNPSTQNAAALIAETRRKANGGPTTDGTGNIDVQNMKDYPTAAKYVALELDDSKFPNNDSAYQRRVKELLTAANSLGTVDSDKIRKDIDTITALKQKSTENQDKAWDVIKSVLKLDKNGKSTVANIDLALTELNSQTSKLSLTPEDIATLKAKIEDSRPKSILRRPPTSNKETATIVNTNLANVIKWSLANTLKPENPEDRLLLAKIKSRGFANEAYMSDDASLSKGMVEQAIQNFLGYSELPIDAAIKFKQTIPKQYNDAVDAAKIYLSDKYKDKVSEALYDNAQLILKQAAIDFGRSSGTGLITVNKKPVSTTTINGVRITRISK